MVRQGRRRSKFVLAEEFTTRLTLEIPQGAEIVMVWRCNGIAIRPQDHRLVSLRSARLRGAHVGCDVLETSI